MGREYNSTSESTALKGGVASTYLAQTGATGLLAEPPTLRMRSDPPWGEDTALQVAH